MENLKFPFFFSIPHVGKLCAWYSDLPYTVLGMGEVLIPAISVNYALIHDLSTLGKTVPVYFLVNVTLLLTGYFFAGLSIALVPVNQPVLIFVLPIMVAGSLLTAFLLKDFKDFLHGHKVTSARHFGLGQTQTQTQTQNSIFFGSNKFRI